MPLHKVDDISHLNFTDRDHLWFDPNWHNGGSGTGSGGKSSNNNDSKKSDDDDPMAAMLENNAKNPKVSSHIFVNDLHAPEYAEVDPGGGGGVVGDSNGPYATTNLMVESSHFSSIDSGNRVRTTQHYNVLFFQNSFLVHPICSVQKGEKSFPSNFDDALNFRVCSAPDGVGGSMHLH